MAENITTPGENIKADGDSLIIYPDKRKMIRRLNLNALSILLPVAAGIFVLFGFLKRLLLSIPQHAFTSMPPIYGTLLTLLTYGPWCVVALYFVLYVLMRAFLQRQNRPFLTLSPEGLTLGGSGTQIGLLYWDEIGEVRPYTFIHRFVGIVPRDPAALYKRLGRRSLPLRLTAWCIPLYRLFGIFIAPIGFSQEALPMSADELVILIRDRRPLDPPRPAASGVWPPAPQKTR